MTALRKTTGKTEDIYSLAKRMYDDAGRNGEKAVASLIGHMRRRPSLQETAFKLAAEQLIGNVIRGDRDRILRGEDMGAVSVQQEDNIVSLPSKQGDLSVQASNERIRKVGIQLTGLYTAKFRHGGQEFLLGTATPEQLAPIASHYLGQGIDMVRKGRWLEMVISSAKPNLPIHKSVRERELKKMLDTAMSVTV